MNTDQQNSKIRELKRLLFAHFTLQDVTAACEFLIAHDSDEQALFYGPFFTGICVSYMRPFVRADGLGTLPEYEKFPQGASDHTQTHEDLKKGRHWVFAHNSAKDSPSLLADALQGAEMMKIRILVNADGSIQHVASRITWPKSRLPAIISLCQFQMDRISSDANKLIQHVCKGKQYKHGDYILGETFP